jgi:hypothetical protein
MKNGMFRLQRVQGETLQVGKSTVTPISRRLSLGLPDWLTASKGFTFIYQQPASVRIEQDGQVSELPIRDYQTIIIASMLIGAIVFVFIGHCVGLKEKIQ